MKVQIENTGKQWKALKALGVCVTLFGVLLIVSGELAVGFIICLVAAGLQTFRSLGEWWNHG
jgi:hypothetical protein